MVAPFYRSKRYLTLDAIFYLYKNETVLKWSAVPHLARGCRNTILPWQSSRSSWCLFLLPATSFPTEVTLWPCLWFIVIFMASACLSYNLWPTCQTFTKSTRLFTTTISIFLPLPICAFNYINQSTWISRYLIPSHKQEDVCLLFFFKVAPFCF